MSKQLVTAGSDIDLSANQPIKEILIGFIKDNWDESFSPNMTPKDSVKWRLWWTGTNGLHIQTTEVLSMVQTRALGLMPGLISYRSMIVLDLFSRSLNQVYPRDLAAACSFIEQLIETNADGLKDKGVTEMRIFRAMEQKEADPTSSIYHYAIEVEVISAKSAVNLTRVTSSKTLVYKLDVI